LAALGTVEEKLYDLHFDANVKGLFFTVQKGLPLMNDGGAIILTGSIAAIKGFPALSVYSATKAAVRSFARNWINDLRERHIRVNVISPGHIDTPILESLQQGDALTRMKEEIAKAVRLADWEIRMKSRKRSHSSHQMKRAISLASSFSSMAVSLKSSLRH